MYSATTLLIVSSDKCLYTLKYVLRVTLDTSTMSLLMVSRNENTQWNLDTGNSLGKSQGGKTQLYTVQSPRQA